MEEEILNNLENPRLLEQMYRSNKREFKRSYDTLYPQIADDKIATYWFERLNYESPTFHTGTVRDILFVIFASLVAGFLIKIPEILALKEDVFFLRNASFLFLPMLTSYFIWKNKLPVKDIVFIASVLAISFIFIHLIPFKDTSDTVILSCFHLPLIIWAILGFAYSGDRFTSYAQRLQYLKYNGDLVVITTVILIAGFILSGITIALFSLIGYSIEVWYMKNIGLMGIVASPIVGTYVIQNNPQLVSKVSPVIAKIFSPLVLIMLIVYIIAIIVSDQNLYQDRQFLLIFNLLLIGVMAIIAFSMIETSKMPKHLIDQGILFVLSLVTIVVNLFALSAIIFRISEWGFTPNRTAVLGSNLIILTHLLIVSFDLFQILRRKSGTHTIADSIASYLPIYILWAVVVTFIFPFIFHFQ